MLKTTYETTKTEKPEKPDVTIKIQNTKKKGVIKENMFI